MTSIALLLNPVDSIYRRARASDSVDSVVPAASPIIAVRTTAVGTGTPQLQTMSKEASKFEPCELQDSTARAEHEKFQVEPIGQIAKFPRHIPYNSGKRNFSEKTGCEAIEAYHYTFRMPSEDPSRDPHIIMWDYNTGLVRITALFKSLGHSKTMPARVMNANPGLKEIFYSITGGAIAAQGYWVPFEAARAIAKHFCWCIRYVLTPIFGLDFPDNCIPPEDSDFMRLDIDPSIIANCLKLAKRMKPKAKAHILPKESQAAPPIERLRSFRARSRRKVNGPDHGDCTNSDQSPVRCARKSLIGWNPKRRSMSNTYDYKIRDIPLRCRHSVRYRGEVGDISAVDRELCASDDVRAAHALMQLHQEDEAKAMIQRSLQQRKIALKAKQSSIREPDAVEVA